MTQLFKEATGALWKLTLLQRDQEQFEAKTKETYQQISRRMREDRKKAGIGLREMARRLELSAAYVSDVELGRRLPTKDFVSRFYAVVATPVR